MLLEVFFGLLEGDEFGAGSVLAAFGGTEGDFSGGSLADSVGEGTFHGGDLRGGGGGRVSGGRRGGGRREVLTS